MKTLKLINDFLGSQYHFSLVAIVASLACIILAFGAGSYTSSKTDTLLAEAQAEVVVLSDATVELLSLLEDQKKYVEGLKVETAEFQRVAIKQQKALDDADAFIALLQQDKTILQKQIIVFRTEVIGLRAGLQALEKQSAFFEKQAIASLNLFG